MLQEIQSRFANGVNSCTVVMLSLKLTNQQSN